MSFEPLDFYRIEDSLEPEERIVRDTVREFVEKEFLPIVVAHVRQDGSFPMELVPKMAELGLFASPEAAVGAVVEQTPAGRLGEVSDMADAVVFLASDQAAYLTGQVLHVSGGMYM